MDKIVYFFFWRDGWAISEKNDSCSAKTGQKTNGARGATEKKPASAFLYSGRIFGVKNFLHKLLPTKTNHAQPKCEKKNECPRKLHNSIPLLPPP